MQDNYRIRPDYVARAVNVTLEDEPGDYWTPLRIQTVRDYQYDVYRIAAELARKRLTPSAAMADIGCGYPNKLGLLTPHVRSIDLYDQPSMSGLLARDFPEWRFHGIDLERPGTPDARYDLVVCADVLEHLLDPDPCVAFLKQIVTAEGYLVISTPERDVVRGPDCLASPKPEHVREWTRAEFADYLASRGLSVERTLLVPPRRLEATRYDATRSWTDPTEPTAQENGCQVVIATKG